MKSCPFIPHILSKGEEVGLFFFVQVPRGSSNYEVNSNKRTEICKSLLFMFIHFSRG